MHECRMNVVLMQYECRMNVAEMLIEILILEFSEMFSD